MEPLTGTLSGTIQLFKYYKQLAEKAVEQISDKQLHETPKPGVNSVAILMKHIAGNSRSRWTNFRTEDGEKPWRNRDQEFEDTFESKEEVLEYWEIGWEILFASLCSIRENELNHIIYIRNETHTILDAVLRNLAHVSYHVGQIVQLSREYAGENWKSLTIPPGKTEEYNKEKFSKEKSEGMYRDRLDN